MSKGFTLIEVMIAVFVTVVGVVGVYALIPHILETTAFNTDRFIAAQLAQEGIEIVRNIRDTNFLYMLYQDINFAWNSYLVDNCIAGCELDYRVLGNDWTVLPRINPPLSIDQYLRVDPATGFYSYNPAHPMSKFKREIKTVKLDEGTNIERIRIEVTVYWGGESFILEDVIYNWR